MKAMIRAFALIVSFTAAGALLRAQADKTITVLVVDAKTGTAMKPSNFEVRIDRGDTVHNEYMHMNDDGSAQLLLPDGTAVLSIDATYDSSMETYVNCATAKEKAKSAQQWYPVADILKTGVVGANECGKAHLNPKPGVIALFVRKRDWRDMPTD